MMEQTVKETNPSGRPNPRGPGNENPAPLIENDEDIDRVPLYQKKRFFIPLLIVAVIGAVGWWYWYANLRGYDSTDDAYVDANRLSVSSKVLGRITELAADEGDSVKQDQVLVRLDASDLQAQEEQAKAAYVSSQQNITLAKVNLDKATDDLHRAETQFKSNIIPKEQFDHIQKADEAAKAQYAIANAQTTTSKAQLGVIRTQLQNMEIRSPLEGVISKRWVLPGDVVQAGQPIFTIYDIKHLWVTANFEETKLSSIHIGDPVEVSIDTYPDMQFRGTVFQLGTNTAAQFSLIPPNNASGNFTKITQRVPVKISIDRMNSGGNNKATLLPGMSVEVKIKVSR
jgi:membrane fusion protein (multidrug efflux system)